MCPEKFEKIEWRFDIHVRPIVKMKISLTCPETEAEQNG